MNRATAILFFFLCLIFQPRILAQQTGASEKTQMVALPPAKEELLMEPGSAFDRIGEAFWLFGDAGNEHYAYAAKRGKKWLMVVDGKEGPEFLEVNSPRFSRDGQHFAYSAMTQKGETIVLWAMVADGKRGPEFEELSLPVFSPDSQHLAYRGKRDNYREVLILDGKVTIESEYASQPNFETLGVTGLPLTREFDDVGQPVFSPDGQHLAYRVKQKNHEVIVLDGKETAEFEDVGQPVFSPDGQHLAYRVKHKKNHEAIVLDGKETTEFEQVTKPVFSPDSRRLAYLGKRGNKWRMVVDGQEGPEIEARVFYGPLFSPDSQHALELQLQAKFGGATFFKGNRWDVLEVRDGKPSGLHHLQNFRSPNARLDSPIFSPDGQRLAYILWDIGTPAQPYRLRCVVVDGQDGREYLAQRIDLAFSPDSRHFVYTVHGGLQKNRSTVVTDGQEAKLYDDVIGGVFRDATNASGSPEHAFVYIAREGRKFYRVTQPLP
jgi:Tol biopolymer transport system component